MILNLWQPKFAAELVANDSEMWPVLGKGVCSDSNQSAQLLQMAARKSLEMMSGMILNQPQVPQPKLQPNQSQMKCYVWKPTLREQASIFYSKIFLAINNHLQCYWPAIHNLILKMCPKFLVVGSHFLGLGDVWGAISKNCANWKYFNSKLCWMQ